MKRFLILFPCCALAGSLFPPRVIDKDHAIQIEHCHSGDRAIIHVQPIPESASRLPGWMFTSKTNLALADLSMAPSGTNRLDIQTVCSGSTSKPVMVFVEIRREPSAPKIHFVRARPWEAPRPPLPSGLVLALPDGTNRDQSYQARARLGSGKHRSQ